MKRLLPAVLLLALLASTARANEFIWREAENATVTTFNHDGWYEGSSNIDRTLLSPGYPGGAQGAWSAHYVLHADSPAYVEWDDVNVTEGGAYTWWIRLAPTNTSYTYSIDGGPAVAMDLSRQHEVIDPARPGLMDDLHFLGWVDVGQLDLSPGPHTLRVTAVYNAAHDSTVGGIDCMCLLNFPWTPTGTLQPGGSTNPDPAPGPGVWYPLHVGQDEFSDRSIIDMRSLVAATTGIPAGVHGHLTRVQDHFELSGRPGTPVKFWGVCATEPSMYLSSDPAMPSLYATQARFYVKHGINLVRRHPMIGDVGQDMAAGAMDDYDRWFAALKAQGIYTDWSVFYPDSVPVSRSFLPATPDADFLALCSRAGVTPDDLWNELPDGGTAGTKKLGGMDCFVDWYQAGEWNWERNLLLHTNPYTGMRYVDDPALAIVEVQNEDSIFWWWPLSNLSGQATPYYPNHAMLLRRMWFEWLQKKYADDAALAAAWGSGKQAGDSVETFHTDMMLYSPWNMADDGPPYAADQKARMGDFIRFLAETQRAVFQKRFDNVTALGFQGVQVSTAWKAGGPAGEAANLWADDAGDAIDRHAYMGGTTDGSGWYVSTGGVNDDIQLSAPGRFILGGENFTTTLGPTSLYQVEDKPVMMTEWNDEPPTKWRAEMAPLFAFYGMGLQGWDASFHFAGSHPWMETGWPGPFFGPSPFVSETPLYMGQFPALAFAVYHGHVQQADLAAARRISLDDLFSGVDPVSQPLPDGGYSGQDNVYTPPEVSAIGRVTFKADASLSSSDSTRSDWSNYWDQSGQTITSMTGQLVWDYGNRVVQVKTPKTEALIGWSGGRGAYDLGSVQVNVDAATPFASIIFTPLDNQPLATSRHILVTALAQDKQAGTVYDSDSELSALGGPPLLLQPVQATITLGGGPVTDVHAVDVYGVPEDATVPLSGNAFTINGNYTTYYYEINRAADVPAIALSTAALTPSCLEGGSPDDGTFQVWNSGTGSLSYTVSDDAAWLSVDPSSGASADDADRQTHTVSYSTAGLSAGTHTATITVSDPSASNDPQTIVVTLTVHAPPAIALDTTEMDPSVHLGSNAPQQTFQVWNGSEGTLSYTVSEDVSWMSVAPGSGSSDGSGDKQTHTITYDTAALAVGTYDADITVAAAGASNTPQTVAVHLTVLPGPPAIGRSPAALTPACLTGQDAPGDSVDVWNAGDSTLDYVVYTSASDSPAWLAVDPGSGSSTGEADRHTHEVTYSTAGLAAGVYHGGVVISAPGATDPLVTVPVTLTVSAPTSILVDHASLYPTCQPGASPAADQLLIRSSAAMSMAYTITDDADWLAVSPGSGTSTGPADAQAHAVTYSASGLSAGTHDATITVTAAGAVNSPLSIPVHLTVQDTAGPTIHITYPTAADSPLSDSLVTVTGTADDPGGVAAVWVNGVRALNTGTAFSTWRATIPLSQGFDAADAARANTITASGLDAEGRYTADADSVSVDSIGGAGMVERVGLGLQAAGAVVPGDVDTWQFLAADGTALGLSVKAGGKPAPDLRLELYGPTGQQVLTQTGSSLKVKRTLAGSGLYTVRIAPASGNAGTYKLKLSGKPPKAKMKAGGELAGPSAESDYYITLPQGSLLAIKAASKQFQPTVSVLDPIGAPVPMGGAMVAAKGKAQVKGLAMPSGPQPYLTGDYAVCVVSGDGGAGAFSLACSGKAPKPARQTVSYPELVGTSGARGVAPGAPLQLKVVGAADASAHNAVYLGGRLLGIDSAALKSGKGTLNVTVPADMPAGAAQVYFVRSDATMDEKSNPLEVQVAP